jgi:hypothetical protein
VEVSAPSPVWVEGLPGMPAKNHARKREIRMVEYIEELDVESQFDALGQGKPLR